MVQKRYNLGTAEHREFLIVDATRQLDFFKRSLRADGGFNVLDYNGNALNEPQELHSTTRLVHSYALAKSAGFADCDDIIDAGINTLKQRHWDAKFGGYYWSIDQNEIIDDVKLAYGHVFVLLAASSAKSVDHPDAQTLIDLTTEVLLERFWDSRYSLLQDEFERDWQPFSNYRGMNANMHGAEAFLAAFEATGENSYLTLAQPIFDFFTSTMAEQYEWRIPEHYDAKWRVDAEYEGNPMFRPRGSTPGHSFELGRLLIQYWDLTGRLDDEFLLHARELITTAFTDAAHPKGGFIYTLHLDGSVDRANRYWWPVTEAINALASCLKIEDDSELAEKYASLWQFADDYLIDHQSGGWYPEIDDGNKPKSQQFKGKPDIYHALQADLIPITHGVSHLAQQVRGLI